jgi:AcrR family transcriptional regulator
MKKVPKGESTRITIMDNARDIFNNKGINLTLDNLATEMKITKGKITNHFPTKDKLFLAILADYEEKLAALVIGMKEHYVSRTLSSLVTVLSNIMDLQYQYRCCIVYLNVLSPAQSEIRDHIKSTLGRNLGAIKVRMMGFVEGKILDSAMLEPDMFDAFIFIYINQLTQWVVYFDMYDKEKGFEKMKPVYIKGIMYHVYGPYLTVKGRKELQQLKFG